MSISLRSRIRGAYRGFLLSFILSSIGTAIDVLVFAFSRSMILLTDLVHWLVDTTLEATFVIAIYFASRTSRRYPWSVILIENYLIVIALISISATYAYLFLDYVLGEYTLGEVSTTSFTPLIATVLGGVFTLATYITQSKNYKIYRLDILRVDKTHALLDLVASVITSLGVFLTVITLRPGVELLFILLSMLFVIHSVLEILRDLIKTVIGANIDYEMSMRIYSRLLRDLDARVRLIDVKARKIGSFYVVEIVLGLNPNIRILEAHRIRSRIIRDVREVSDLVYHVDIVMKPSRIRGRFSGSKREV
ncbi:MAG: cation transporter [Sulfolobales archaeon]